MGQGDIAVIHDDQEEEKYDPEEDMIEYSLLDSFLYELVKPLIIIDI